MITKVKWADRVQEEREARIEAEELLEERSRQLWRANGELTEAKENLEHLVEVRTQELSVALEQAQRANNAKSLFLNCVNHELRTPLNSLLNASRLIRQAPHSPEQQQMLDLIGHASEDLRHRIIQILDLTSVESGQSVLEESDIFLPELIDDVLAVYEQQAVDKGLTLWGHCNRTTTRWIRADASRLKQILLNLIENAVKFTERGQVILNVKRQQHKEHPGFLFSVMDSGPGIPEEVQGELFQPFSSRPVSAMDSEYGLGLGLSIALYNSELLKGKLSVKSNSKGSCFELLLPLSTALPKKDKQLSKFRAIARDTSIRIMNSNAKKFKVLQKTLRDWRLKDPVKPGDREVIVLVDPTHKQLEKLDQPYIKQEVIALYSRSEASKPTLKHRKHVWQFRKPITSFELLKQLLTPKAESKLKLLLGSVADAASARHVLIVDDSLANQMVTQSMLNRLGHQTTCVSSGREALDTCDQLMFDLILMDLRMPGMDGFETTRRILSESRNASTPVVALTANTIQTDRKQCEEVGMVDYLTKPLDHQLLRAALTKWCKTSRNAADNTTKELPGS